MKLFIKILLTSYVLLYAVCAFVSWDVAVLAHTTEGCRLGYILGGTFFATVGFFAYASICENE
jgi:hypothetical protein